MLKSFMLKFLLNQDYLAQVHFFMLSVFKNVEVECKTKICQWFHLLEISVSYFLR